MPTTPELKALLRPLLKRRPDLGFARRVLFFAPLTHYLRGVVFVSKMSGAADAIPFACPLYTGNFHVEFNQTVEQDDFRVQPEWKDDPEKASRELCDIVEQRLLPPVEAIVDFTKHVEAPPYLNSLYWNGLRIGFWRALAACTLGDYDSAEELLDLDTDWNLLDAPQASRFGEFSERYLYLFHILRTDRSQILPLLHEWEAFTVKECRMVKYWKPTPFPCEL